MYGKEFKVITDHKALVSLFHNPSSKPSARIKRWLLELKWYRFTVEYRPSASNPADYASRHPVGDPESHSYDVESEEHISFVARNATPKAVTSFEIESATAKDSMLRAAMSAVKSGYWYKASPPISLSELSRYEQVKEQLTCTDTVLLKSDRLVIPATLQERIVDIAREGHLGIVVEFSLLCCTSMAHAKILRYGRKQFPRMRRSAAGWRFPSLRGGGWDKKGGSVATSRGMNAKQGDYKCGDRINTLPNTHGYYDGLWRKSVLIYASHVAISAQSYQ